MEDFALKYHKILCNEFPSWLCGYVCLPVLQRLKGIGLLCGTDWTALYRNRFFYSRFDHSVGTALVAWNFSQDKKQTLAALFHDIATGVFSHVNDFRKGDALKQELSENETFNILAGDEKLAGLLKKDRIELEEIADYHIYPLCDNEIPRLSADRLEYMFPSNMALAFLNNGHVWTFEETEEIYKNICVLKNESGKDELGFSDLKLAELYTEGFCDCSLILQHNENKLALNMLGKIVNLAIEKKLITEKDCMALSEKKVIEIFDEYAVLNDDYLSSLIKKWRTMTQIERFCQEPGQNYYSVNLEVKKRYIDPLVKQISGKVERVSEASFRAQKMIQSLLSFKDSEYGAVKLL